METVDSDKQGHCHGETTDKQNKHAEKPIKNESAPCKMVEVSKVRTEVKSVSTQTEESQELILGDKQHPSTPAPKQMENSWRRWKIKAIKSLQTRHPLSDPTVCYKPTAGIQRVPRE